MNGIKYIIRLTLLLLLFASCRKDEKLNVQQPVGLGGDVTAATSIDKWIQDSLTTPYNIAVKYRWDPSNASLYRTVTPTDENRVVPLLSALRKLWILPYTAETGSEFFMKKYTPKQLVLIGSVEYDETYSVKVGEAEGGNQVSFFDVNQHYFQDLYTSSKFAIHTAHHEFGHILNQNVIYQQDFIGVSSRLGLPGYTATWYNISNEDALSYGYGSSYAMASKDEDFVETIAIMLTEGRSKWEEMKAATNATARQALQQKEDYVVSYYRQAWNIDFYSLQTRVQTALNALYPPPAVSALYGYNLTYGTASVNPANTTMLPQPAAFTSIFTAAKTGLAAVVSGGVSGRVLDSFAVVHYNTFSVTLDCYFHTTAAPATQEIASYLYNYTISNGLYTFVYAGSDPNGTTFRTGLAPLVNYISGNRFTITWYADPSITVYPRVKFTPQTIPGTYFLARLLP